jgi:hypothetical protein
MFSEFHQVLFSRHHAVFIKLARLLHAVFSCRFHVGLTRLIVAYRHWTRSTDMTLSKTPSVVLSRLPRTTLSRVVVHECTLEYMYVDLGLLHVRIRLRTTY